MQSSEPPPVVAFLCNWAAWRAYLDVQSKGDGLPANLHPVRIPCAGRIDPALILAALERGAGGVIVAGCPGGECRYGAGPEHCAKEAGRISKLLHLLGLDSSRVSWLEADPADSEAFAEQMRALLDQAERSGPTPWAAQAGA